MFSLRTGKQFFCPKTGTVPIGLSKQRSESFGEAAKVLCCMVTITRDCYSVFEVGKKCVLSLIIHQGLQVRIGAKKRHYERVLIDERSPFCQA